MNAGDLDIVTQSTPLSQMWFHDLILAEVGIDSSDIVAELSGPKYQEALGSRNGVAWYRSNNKT